VNLVRRGGKIIGVTYYFIGCTPFPCLQYVDCDYIDHLVRDFCMNVKELGLCTRENIEDFVSPTSSRQWLLSDDQFRRIDDCGKVNPIPQRVLRQWNITALEMKQYYMKLLE